MRAAPYVPNAVQIAAAAIISRLALPGKSQAESHPHSEKGLLLSPG